jgi:hypothetical protein
MANNIVKEVNKKSLFDDASALLSAAISFDVGQHLFLDTTNHLIKPVAAEADSATYLGVATCKVVSGKLVSPYNTDVVASQAVGAASGPVYGVIASLTLKTGDSLSPGQVVGLDPATGIDGVQATVTTKAIGVYQGKAISSAVAGTKILVLVGCQAFTASLGGI